jgi:hypothetical protein
LTKLIAAGPSGMSSGIARQRAALVTAYSAQSPCLSATQATVLPIEGPRKQAAAAGDHAPRPLQPGDQWKGPGDAVKPLQGHQVGRVDRGGGDPHQHLAGAGPSGTGRSSIRGAAPGASITSARMVSGRSGIRTPQGLQPDRRNLTRACEPWQTRFALASPRARMEDCAMKLWVGLGNPGAKYAGNRHNIGWMAVDRIASDHGFAPFRAKFQGR